MELHATAFEIRHVSREALSAAEHHGHYGLLIGAGAYLGPLLFLLKCTISTEHTAGL